jgi:hypothetical protein
MLSVRITAAGTVFVCCLSFLTAPARACDDRFIKKCEKAAAAEFAAEEAATTPGAKRASKRVKIVASRQSRHTRLVRHRQAPRFAARMARGVMSDSAERRAALPDTPMARRFRGFIDPQPMSQNAFEALRKPHLVSLDFDAAAIVPVVDVPEAALAAPADVSPAAPSAGVTTTPKQDRLAAKPAALMELASAESRPVTLAPAPARAAALEQAVATAPVVMTEAAPAPTEPQNGKFAFHGLVLALCGALGAASALRFIVGA